MDFAELAKKRQSERSYLEKPVERELLETCIEAARMAPSSCNGQPWSFVITDDPALRDKVAETATMPPSAMNKFARQAPVIVSVVLESDTLISRLGAAVRNSQFVMMDVGMAVENFCLQAAELGLGTCIMGWVQEKKLKKLLKIPFNKRVALLITVGYPESGVVREKKRKPLGEILKYNSY